MQASYDATDHSPSATKSPPKGRRVFKSGREISGIEPTVATAQHQGPESKSAQHSSSSKPRQISSGQGQATRDSWKAKPMKPTRKSARDAIFDNSAVSLGPRQTKMSNSQNTHSGFMKPDRVDEPTHKTDSVKVKRPRAADSTEPDGPVDSRKKKVRKQRSAESDADEQ
ncbi:unnamed protein product [Mycena citricolor]|uniref:Uncharacterized protein n=1 Tax=Mycena citricolor TaxID=2018698 RepID=A0AAD2HBW7_9AGAR|nr:unnamed protein product [Mycena citricolor]